jgi:hypothetical protein
LTRPEILACNLDALLFDLPEQVQRILRAHHPHALGDLELQ